MSMHLVIPEELESALRRRARACGRDPTDLALDAIHHGLGEVGDDEQVDEAELTESLAMLERSMVDIRGGRVAPAKEAIKTMAAELGIELTSQGT